MLASRMQEPFRQGVDARMLISSVALCRIMSRQGNRSQHNVARKKMRLTEELSAIAEPPPDILTGKRCENNQGDKRNVDTPEDSGSYDQRNRHVHPEKPLQENFRSRTRRIPHGIFRSSAPQNRSVSSIIRKEQRYACSPLHPAQMPRISR